MVHTVGEISVNHTIESFSRSLLLSHAQHGVSRLLRYLVEMVQVIAAHIITVIILVDVDYLLDLEDTVRLYAGLNSVEACETVLVIFD